MLQQFAVIVEEASNPFTTDQFLDNSDRQMGLAYTNRADQEQTSLVDRVLFDELAGSHASRGQRTIQTIDFKSRELTMFVTPGDAGRCQQAPGPRSQLAG